MIAYLSAGTFLLAGILAAVFLIGEKIGQPVQYVFGPIAFSTAIFAAAQALTAGCRHLVGLEQDAHATLPAAA